MDPYKIMNEFSFVTENKQEQKQEQETKQIIKEEIETKPISKEEIEKQKIEFSQTLSLIDIINAHGSENKKLHEKIKKHEKDSKNTIFIYRIFMVVLILLLIRCMYKN
jgi:hypothetical protein